MHDSFIELLSISDAKLLLSSSNERVLTSDMLYNSLEDGDLLKKKIEERSMTEPEFTNVFFLFSLPKPEQAETEKKVVSMPDVAKVPVIAGHTEKYVLQLMEQGFSKDDIRDIGLIKRVDGASVSKILKLKNEGYSLTEIHEFYEIRENNAVSCMNGDKVKFQNLSIERIIKLYEILGKDFTAVQTFLDNAMELHKNRLGFFDSTINAILKIAANRRESIECTMERLNKDSLDCFAVDIKDDEVGSEQITGSPQYGSVWQRIFEKGKKV